MLVDMDGHVDAPAAWKLNSCKFIQDQPHSRGVLTKGLIIEKPDSTGELTVCALYQQLISNKSCGCGSFASKFVEIKSTKSMYLPATICVTILEGTGEKPGPTTNS